MQMDGSGYWLAAEAGEVIVIDTNDPRLFDFL
jgi:hypothetical protein